MNYLICVPDDMFHVPNFKFTILNFMCPIGLVSENYVPEISGMYNTKSSWPDDITDIHIKKKLKVYMVGIILDAISMSYGVFN